MQLSLVSAGRPYSACTLNEIHGAEVPGGTGAVQRPPPARAAHPRIQKAKRTVEDPMIYFLYSVL